MSGLSANNREVEIKLRAADAGAARRLLADCGLSVVSERVFESNIVYDTAGLDLRRSGRLLRLRRAGGRSILTFKGPADAGRHKSREELETELADPNAMAAIIERLGYSAVFVYEKYRMEYGAAGEQGVVTLDETPIGVFLEIEGSPEWIDRMAERLGYSHADYVTASYARLYLDYCAERRLEPRHMTFEHAPEGGSK